MANSTTKVQLNDGRMAETVTENKTLAVEHQGLVQNVVADELEVTLPATVVGLVFTVRNGGVPHVGGSAGSGSSGTAIVKITPAAADLIAGLELTADVADSINNTKTTSNVGDEITLLGNGTTGWNVVSATGVWAQIAI